MADLEIDEEFRRLIRPLDADERQRLEGSLIRDGCRDPLTVWGTTLIDGHHRFEICREHGIEFKMRPAPDWVRTRGDAKLWVIQHQLGRRNLNAAERAHLAHEAEPLIAERARTNQRLGPRNKLTQTFGEASDRHARETTGQVAKMAGVSHETYRKAKAVFEAGDQELIEQVRQAKTSINAAYKQVRAERAARVKKFAEDALVPEMKKLFHGLVPKVTIVEAPPEDASTGAERHRRASITHLKEQLFQEQRENQRLQAEVAELNLLLDHVIAWLEEYLDPAAPITPALVAV